MMMMMMVLIIIKMMMTDDDELMKSIMMMMIIIIVTMMMRSRIKIMLIICMITYMTDHSRRQRLADRIQVTIISVIRIMHVFINRRTVVSVTVIRHILRQITFV